MHPSAQAATVWNIRNLLITAVALLSLLGLAVSGHVLHNANVDRAIASDAASINETADLLLESAGQWARERGATNLALNAANPAADAQLAAISNYRKSADQAFERAVARLTDRNFANRDQLVAAAKRANDVVLELRRQADAEISKPAKDRKPAIVSKWAPTITALIVASQNLRVAAAMDEDNVQARLSSLQNLKHFVWIMSEYLGRERAMVAGMIAASRPMTAQEVSTLGAFRGRVEAAWDYVQAYAAKSSAPPAVSTAADRLRERVFQGFEDTRKAIYAAGIGGGTYPINSAEWFSRSTAAIDEVIALSALASEEAARLAESAQRGSLRTLMLNAFLMAFSLALASLTLWMVISRVVRSLGQITAAMGKIAGGETSVVVPCTTRRDEMGSMARALLVFKENAVKVLGMQAEREALEKTAREERAAAMAQLADQFEGAVGEIVETVSSASTQLEASAGTLSTTAERAQELTTMVAAASEEASTNVQSVASASEEMASSVNEIGRQVQESARIAGEAVAQARKTHHRVNELSEASRRIGDVVELINTVASQTNLLALNATIEAARAGEAGRGFAVVATEVKALAEQTAKATEEIRRQISDIQNATQDSVSAIEEIGVTIGRISEISSTIASAVEEQGAATQEVARNVQQAAQGTQQVASNITDVQRGADATGAASSQVLTFAQSLSQESSRLKSEVGRFLEMVRAA
jgi:methyl-accepting chemotaxis protein